MTPLQTLRQQAQAELTGNILPFWARHAFDEKTGYLSGVVTNDLRHVDDVPRHAVLCSRILWTYAAALRVQADERWTATGVKALRMLANHFWDRRHGGIYWSLHAKGGVISNRKQVYAQAFTIYGLTEWYSATGDADALNKAKELYHLIEHNARDLRGGGYLEALSADWGRLEDMRLSDKDLNSPKSMNTMLHVLEAYTALLRVWPDAGLRASLRDLLTVLLDKVYTTTPFPRFALFFDMEWRSLNDKISYGHDIETSWLAYETALAIGDTALLERTKLISLAMAEAVLANGVDQDGSLFYDGLASGPVCTDKHWWPQAEAVVGFLNAFQLSGDSRFEQATLKAWNFIETKLVDRVHGEWFSHIGRDGKVLGDYDQNPDFCKMGPWKCPYHNARACIEVINRLKE